MIENLTFYEKVRIWLSEIPYSEKPLLWLDSVVEKSKIIFQNLGVWLRYILILFLLTALMVLLKIFFRFLRNWRLASFADFSDANRMRFWSRYAQADERKALFEVAELFDEAKKDVAKSKKMPSQSIGFDLF